MPSLAVGKNSKESSSIEFQRWPDEHLETVAQCPLCGGESGTQLQSNLIDDMVNPPTGLWGFVRCGNCAIAYLSPRPTEPSIKQAYEAYYTHTSAKDDLVPGKLRQLKDNIAERYYSASRKSGSPFDRITLIAARLILPFALLLDAKSRHIFKVDGAPGRLLDIGCGNGEFIKFASRFGWQVVGVDFDENAIKEAASGGLDARYGSINAIGSHEKFDFITMSHVIEHVYDPLGFLRKCYGLLEDGGLLWLETPNVDGIGRSVYGAYWRGYEPPRHLILFNTPSMRETLFRSGFTKVEQKLHGLAGLYMGLSSERTFSRANPCNSIFAKCIRKVASISRILYVEIAQLLFRNKREFLTFIACK